MDVESLIAQGEGQRTEFKESFGEERQAIESLCAFANSEGGTVLIGVRDDDQVRGVHIGENTLENFANNLNRETQPPYIRKHCNPRGRRTQDCSCIDP